MPRFEIDQLERDSKKEGALQAKAEFLQVLAKRFRSVNDLISQYEIMEKREYGNRNSNVDYNDISAAIDFYQHKKNEVCEIRHSTLSQMEALRCELEGLRKDAPPEQDAFIQCALGKCEFHLGDYKEAKRYFLKIPHTTRCFPEAARYSRRLMSRLDSRKEKNQLSEWLDGTALPSFKEHHLKNLSTSIETIPFDTLKLLRTIYCCRTWVTESHIRPEEYRAESRVQQGYDMSQKKLLEKSYSERRKKLGMVQTTSPELRYKRLRLAYEQYFQCHTATLISSHDDSIPVSGLSSPIVSIYEKYAEDFRALLRDVELTDTLAIKIHTMSMRLHLILALHTGEMKYIDKAKGLSTKVLSDSRLIDMKTRIGLFEVVADSIKSADTTETAQQVQTLARRTLVKSNLCKDYKPKYATVMTHSLFSKEQTAKKSKYASDHTPYMRVYLELESNKPSFEFFKRSGYMYLFLRTISGEIFTLTVKRNIKACGLASAIREQTGINCELRIIHGGRQLNLALEKPIIDAYGISGQKTLHMVQLLRGD